MRQAARVKARADRPAATRAGALRSGLSGVPDSRPLNAGPTVKPRPKLAPRKPMPRARSSGLVMSAMAAMTMPTLPAMAPDSARATNTMARLSAKASTT